METRVGQTVQTHTESKTTMIDRRIATLTLVCGLMACGGGYESDRVLETADGFWAASYAGQMEVAERYILEGGSATLNKPEDGKPPFDSYTLGKVELDGNRATVETSIQGANGNSGLDMEFKTVLVMSRSMWWVDLDNTTGEIMQVMLGVNMEELGQAMADAMGEAIDGMAEGMQEGVEQMAKEMNAAMSRRQK